MQGLVAVKFHGGTSGRLGAVHGQIGAADKKGRILPVFGKETNADAGGNLKRIGFHL